MYDEDNFKGTLSELTEALTRVQDLPNVFVLLLAQSEKFFIPATNQEVHEFYEKVANKEVLKKLADIDVTVFFNIIEILKGNLDKYHFDTETKSFLLKPLIEGLIGANIFEAIPGRYQINNETIYAVTLFKEILQSALDLELDVSEQLREVGLNAGIFKKLELPEIGDLAIEEYVETINLLLPKSVRNSNHQEEDYIILTTHFAKVAYLGSTYYFVKINRDVAAVEDDVFQDLMSLEDFKKAINLIDEDFLKVIKFIENYWENKPADHNRSLKGFTVTCHP